MQDFFREIFLENEEEIEEELHPLTITEMFDKLRQGS